jgi:uncharacterized protein
LSENLPPHLPEAAPSRWAWLPQCNWKDAVLLTWAILGLTVVYYHGHFSFLGERQQLFGWFGLNVVVLLIVPLLIIRFVFRESLAEFGFTLGRADIWGKYLLVFLIVFVPVAAIASRLPEFQRFYPRYIWARQDHLLIIPSIIGWCCYFLAWEFFFRGFLLFGLGRRLGPIAIFIQMVPFTMAHFPKPELESLSAIIAGIALGIMAWRSRSFVGTWLLHWLSATAMDLFVVFWPLR